MSAPRALLGKAPWVATLIVAATALSCRSAAAETAVCGWVDAIGRGDLQTVRGLYDPMGWPDNYVVWERDFARSLAASADVTYENQATFDPGRAQIVVRTRTADVRIAWIFKLYRRGDAWVITNILRYFE